MPDVAVCIRDRASYFVKTQAWNLLRECSVTRPPILAAQVATEVGIEVSERKLKGASGLLIPSKTGLQIVLNIEDCQARRNFSCAHELMHTFFLDGKGKVLMEEVMRREGFNAARKLEERLCNIGATELIMPKEMFKKEAAKVGFSIQSLEPLADLFFTSPHATAIRIAQTSGRRCTAMRLKPASLVKGSNVFVNDVPNSSERSYRIAQGSDNLFTGQALRMRTPSSQRFRASGHGTDRTINEPFMSVTVASDSIRKAYDTGTCAYSVEDVLIGKSTRTYDVESKGFSQPPYGYVLALAFPRQNHLI